MIYVLDVLGISNGLALLLVLVLLLLGPYRKFRVVLVYVAWELIATLSLTIIDLLFNGPSQLAKWYARLYWSNDVVVDLFRFLLVILLTYRAASDRVSAGSPGRLVAGRALGGVLAVVLVLPFLLFHPTFRPWPTSAWFNSTSELLNFGAAIMNLVLWGTLLATRKRDLQLVSVSAGLGVVVAGAAISYGLRHLLPPSAASVPNVFLMLTQLAGWAIWCRAFWPAARSHQIAGDALPSPSP
jgi:hypothetical protein